ncbi:MAG: YigZ family protein, partial [Ruminiclostridium sp.]|nr:YigZ family protein [Ruminiclostridium sp.]
MQTCIRTVLKTGKGEYEEKRSRFTAWVYPVSTENEAISLMSALRKKHWDSRHQCFAYIIDGDTTIQRFSDDGEPSGTAGLPILEIIRKKDLSNVLVVVIRYFGGILLGASGLARAYGKAAAAGIMDAQIIMKKQCYVAIVNADYHTYG